MEINAQTRTCQNCKTDFLIEPEDFGFYEKMQVPPPTFCPKCRHLRRLSSAHSMRLYKRTCNAPGHSEEVVSKYPPSAPRMVYDQKFWWSDAWDPLAIGREYDFKRPFFEQLDAFYREAPIPALDVVNSTNCDYCVTAHNSKNCYFVIGGFRAEECLYSDTPAFGRYVVDCYACLSGDTLYECLYCDGSYNLKYSEFSEGCMDSAFLYDCKGCSDCFGCVNLRNKKYCIWNVQYSKEEYRERMKNIDLSSREKVAEFRQKYAELLSRYPARYANIVGSTDCTGDVIDGGRNCKNCFEIRQGAENCRYVFLGGIGTKDSYDVYGGGLTSSLIYDSKAVVSSEKVLFSDRISDSMDIQYSRNCTGSAHLFACVGLRQKKYCILNKQYSEKEYNELVVKIIAHMDEMPYTDERGIVYRYGEFGPVSSSALPYNESMAQALYPLDEAAARNGGYLWQEPEKKEFEITMAAADIPRAIEAMPDSILKEVLECADKGRCGHGCPGAFRVIPQELGFYRRTKTPIPQFCPVCRYARRLDSIRFRITPIEQIERECECAGVTSKRGSIRNTAIHPHGQEPCVNRFRTSYTPERPEVVYCEQCFQSELS